MAVETIHHITSPTAWRILSLLRLGERHIHYIKPALGITESAFSHALRKLEQRGLIETHRQGREKITRLTQRGRIIYSSLQALCFAISGTDGSHVEDDTALVRMLRESATRQPAIRKTARR